MATFKGKDGVVRVGANAVGEVRSFSVDETAQTTDTTSMGDDYTTHEVIVKEWSGSCEVWFDDTDTNGQNALVNGASVDLSFLMEGATSGSHLLQGTATVTQRNISSSREGIVECSFSFQGNGPLTEGAVV